MYLAIDLGSTQFKAAVFDPALTVKGTGSHTLVYQYPAQGKVELPAEEVRNALVAVTRDALATAGMPATSLKAVAIDSQAQTFAVFDRTGTPRTPFFSWLDERAAPICERMGKTAPWDRLAEHSSFGYLLAGLQACILRAGLDAGDIQVRSSDQVLLLPAWVVQLLTGEAVTDANLAAMSGLFSLPANGWWPEALGALGLSTAQLPRLVPVGARAGLTGAMAAALGLPAGIPVFLAGNDQTAGAYGAEIERRAALLVTLGTAYVVYALAPALPGPQRGIIRGVYPGSRFYRMGADSCGGNVLTWGTALLAGASYDRFFELADQAPAGSRGLVFDPEIVRGGNWTNVSMTQSTPEFARSIIESQIRRVAAMVALVDPDHQSPRLLAAGGGSRRPLMVKLLSEATGRPVDPVSADPLRGAARLAVEAG